MLKIAPTLALSASMRKIATLFEQVSDHKAQVPATSFYVPPNLGAGASYQSCRQARGIEP